MLPLVRISLLICHVTLLEFSLLIKLVGLPYKHGLLIMLLYIFAQDSKNKTGPFGKKSLQNSKAYSKKVNNEQSEKLQLNPNETYIIIFQVNTAAYTPTMYIAARYSDCNCTAAKILDASTTEKTSASYIKSSTSGSILTLSFSSKGILTILKIK